MTRQSGHFAEKIPKSEINTRHCRCANDAMAMPKVLAEHHLPQVFDARRILANDKLREIFDCAHDCPRVPFERCLTPAKQAILVRKYFDENPIPHAGMADVCFDPRD